MEDTQLNINRPLLSVRRITSKAASQRNENRRNRNSLANKSPIGSYKTEQKSDQIKNTGSVPFVWEHSPGRPKDETNKQVETKEKPPKLPPGWILKPKKKDSDTITEELITELQSITKESSDSEDDDDDDDDVESDEAFMDALDTLSRGESSFYNCSASGVSGFDSHVNKPSADPKVRDFMMGRFLPAAKAMASEVPQNNSRKQVVKEKPREMTKLVNLESKNVQLRYGPNFLQDFINDKEEDSDYDDDNEIGNISSKICGLLPRFCLKGSVGFVNPVSGTRATSSSSISSFSETENEPARNAIYEYRSFKNPQLTKNQENGVLKSESVETKNIYNRLQTFPEKNNLSSQKELLLLSDNKTEVEDLLMEKTLYVDTMKSKDDNLKMETQWKDLEVEIDSKKHCVFELPAPPPLPKSPSDSWLWRTVASKQAAVRWNAKDTSSNVVQFGVPEGPLFPIPEI